MTARRRRATGAGLLAQNARPAELEVVVRSNVSPASEVLSWERELLLAHLRPLLAAVLEEVPEDEDEQG